MSSAVASALPPSNGDGPTNESLSNGPSTSIAPSATSTSQAAAGLSQFSMTSIPPHVQHILKSMNEEKLQHMVGRMRALQAAGETEQTSQEYANLLNIFRYFQQVKSMRQQQGKFARTDKGNMTRLEW